VIYDTLGNERKTVRRCTTKLLFSIDRLKEKIILESMKKWTILEILRWTTDYFAQQKLEKSRLQAEYIISHVLKCKRFDLYLRFEEIVNEADRKQIKQMILARVAHVPLQYILGETEFYGYRFFVDRSVLIPRPETEYLVEKLIAEIGSAQQVLDIGTGSGAIAISLKKELPQLNVSAVDISKEALLIAEKNAKENLVEIDFFQSDLFSNCTQKYDVIISNPPYIPAEEYDSLSLEIKDYEPKSALLANDEGLFYYRKILEKAGDFLNENGQIYFEIGHDQAAKIKKIAENVGFSEIEIVQDLNDFDRIMRIK